MNSQLLTATGAGQQENTLPPVRCEPWCVDGTGHTDAWNPADQYCIGEPERVPMTREPLQLLSDGSHELDYMEVLSMREREGRPYESLHRGDFAGVELTPREAQELAHALLRVASTALSGASSSPLRAHVQADDD